MTDENKVILLDPLKWICYWWRRVDVFRPRGAYPAPRCGWCGNRHHSTNGRCDFTVMKLFTDWTAHMEAVRPQIDALKSERVRSAPISNDKEIKK